METGTKTVVALLLSSALISALVNIAWNAISKWLDRKAEAKKEAQKVAHVYLELALQLEAFARQCNAQIYDISDGIDLYRSQHDDAGLKNLRTVKFAFEPEPDWAALPIPFVAQVKTLPERFKQCSAWIGTQFRQWAEFDEAWELEEELHAFFALEACKVASDIRVQIGAGAGELTDLVAHFQSVIESRRRSYVQNPQHASLIPDLKAQFRREFPENKGADEDRV